MDTQTNQHNHREIERFMKKRKSKVYELQLINGKPQMVCSICGGTEFTFVTGFVWFIVSITAFYRICNTCGKKSRHGGAAN